MRVFALSDIHADYAVNKKWIANLSAADYLDDLLILAGDVSDSLGLVEECLSVLVRRFARVLYVPGNHELWVVRDQYPGTSLDKFQRVLEVMEGCGVSMQPFHRGHLSIVPLLGWYDYSFGDPTRELLDAWTDFHACRWPAHFSMHEVAQYFFLMNDRVLHTTNETVISFSHFMPRLDLLPSYIPAKRKMLHPVLGSTGLEAQIRQLNPAIHVYGHSHINRNVVLDGVRYINNAYGYPSEAAITAKELICIYDLHHSR